MRGCLETNTNKIHDIIPYIPLITHKIIDLIVSCRNYLQFFLSIFSKYPKILIWPKISEGWSEIIQTHFKISFFLLKKNAPSFKPSHDIKELIVLFDFYSLRSIYNYESVAGLNYPA